MQSDSNMTTDSYKAGHRVDTLNLLFNYYIHIQKYNNPQKSLIQSVNTYTYYYLLVMTKIQSSVIMFNTDK